METKSVLLQIFRIVAGLFFLLLGCLHFYGTNEMAVFVPLPKGATIFVYATGLAIAACAVGMLFNYRVWLCLLLIAGILSFTAFLVQTPISYMSPDPIFKIISLSNLGKLLLAVVVLYV